MELPEFHLWVLPLVTWIDGFPQPEYCMLHSLGLIKNRKSKCSTNPVHESNTPIFTGFVDVFFNCMLPRIIPTNDETNGNKIIIAATQINFQPFSTIPNKPLCARIGITGNIT